MHIMYDILSILKANRALKIYPTVFDLSITLLVGKGNKATFEQSIFGGLAGV